MKQQLGTLGCEPRALQFGDQEAERKRVLGKGNSSVVYVASIGQRTYVAKVFKVF